ncbi:MAG: hypothetical protein J6Y85_02570 [Alphaproteobacteria bacterium]|nr:hypothetical protein [Alphaproteobacteria bacterium]
MTKVMKNLCILALMAGVILVASDAAAQTSGTTDGFFVNAGTRFLKAFQNVRTMVLIFGGFGLIVLAVAAILGKIKWSALGALAAGLAIVAVAGQVVDYATGVKEDKITDTEFSGVGMMDLK